MDIDHKTEQTCQRIAQEMREMTKADWEEERQEFWKDIANNPELQKLLRAIEDSQVTGASYYSGNCLRFL